MEKLDSKSLMVGDWVNIYVFPNDNPRDDDLFPAIITAITTPLPNEQGEEYIECIFKSEDGGIGCAARPVNTCLPIPLTAEILEKNGFTRFGPDYILKGNHFGLENPSTPSNYLDNYWLRVSIKAVHIEYVHELQHTLRLCGIEKEIML